MLIRVYNTDDVLPITCFGLILNPEEVQQRGKDTVAKELALILSLSISFPSDGY